MGKKSCRGQKRSAFLRRCHGAGSVGLTPVITTPSAKPQETCLVMTSYPVGSEDSFSLVLPYHVHKQFKQRIILILLSAEVWNLRRWCQMNDGCVFLSLLVTLFSVCSFLRTCLGCVNFAGMQNGKWKQLWNYLKLQVSDAVKKKELLCSSCNCRFFWSK